jgi:hypothetical protein
MTRPANRTSLFLTLGIAAVDMLSCAFISAIILFVMFLIPKNQASAGGTGSGHLLVLHWAFDSSPAVLKITLEPHDTSQVAVWSDQAEFSGIDCANLSTDSRNSNACRIIATPDHASGMIVIVKPRKGMWNVSFQYADTVTSENSQGPDTVTFAASMIVREAVTVSKSLLPTAEGPGVLLNQLAKDQRYSQSAINQAFEVK